MVTNQRRFFSLSTLLQDELKTINKSRLWLAQNLHEKIPCKESSIKRTVTKIIGGIILPPEEYYDIYLHHFASMLKTKDNISSRLEDAYQKDKEYSLNSKKIDPKYLLDQFIPMERPDIKITDYRPKNKNTAAITGKDKLGNTLIWLLENLNILENQENKKILLAFQGNKSIFGISSDSENEENNSGKRWYSAISSAIEKGYDFTHIIRLGNNELRIQEFVIRILSLLDNKQGKYTLKSMKDDQTLVPPYGFMLVPTNPKEVIITLSTQDSNLVDAGIWTKDKSLVELFEEHSKLMEDNSREIFQFFNGYTELSNKILKAEQFGGPRYIFLKRLSEITRPKSFYTLESRWAKDLFERLKIYDENKQKDHLEARKQRRLELDRHLTKYPCYYIYQKSIFFDEPSHYETLTKDELADKIEEFDTISDLLFNSNFNIAFLEEEDISKENLNKIKPIFCEVLSSELLFMEFPMERWYLTEESIIVDAFRVYFSNLWKSIDNKKKDKLQIGKDILKYKGICERYRNSSEKQNLET